MGNTGGTSSAGRERGVWVRRSFSGGKLLTAQDYKDLSEADYGTDVNLGIRGLAKVMYELSKQFDEFGNGSKDARAGFSLLHGHTPDFTNISLDEWDEASNYLRGLSWGVFGSESSRQKGLVFTHYNKWDLQGMTVNRAAFKLINRLFSYSDNNDFHNPANYFDFGMRQLISDRGEKVFAASLVKKTTGKETMVVASAKSKTAFIKTARENGYRVNPSAVKERTEMDDYEIRARGKK